MIGQFQVPRLDAGEFNPFGGGGGFGSRWYILDDNREPVQSDMLTAGRWMHEETFKPVGQSKVIIGRSAIPGYGFVATDFLGLDHSFRGGDPVLFECMTFRRGVKVSRQAHLGWRCRTWVQARALHFVVTNVMRKYGKAAMRAYHSGDAREIARIEAKIYGAV